MEGNFISVAASGTSLLPEIPGVALADGGSDNTIGGTAAGAGNVMSGPVELGGDRDVLEGNLIGTDATGLVYLSNSGGGSETVEISGSGNTVGGTTVGARNVIDEDLTITGQYASGTPGNNLIQGNFIGTDITGTKFLSEASLLLIETSNNTIGGTAAGAGNVIVGSHDGSGIYITDGGSSNPTQGNLVQGNFIGTDPTGTVNFGRGSVGITIYPGRGDHNVSNNTIGGTAAGAGNVIAYNVGGIVSGPGQLHPGQLHLRQRCRRAPGDRPGPERSQPRHTRCPEQQPGPDHPLHHGGDHDHRGDAQWHPEHPIPHPVLRQRSGQPQRVRRGPDVPRRRDGDDGCRRQR